MSLILNRADRDSQLFRRLVKHYTERLQNLREQNDADVPQQHTDKLRGQIFEIKAFLQTNKDQPVLEDQ